MIRSCSKFFIPLQRRTSGVVCLNRLYVVSSSRKEFTQTRSYASKCDDKPPLIPRGVKKIFYTTLGMTIVGIGGIVVYAKQDPKFREALETYVPGSDKFFSIVYQEPGTFSLGEIKDKVLSLPNEMYKQGSEALGGITKSTKVDTPVTSSGEKPSKERPPQTDLKKTTEAVISAVDDGKLALSVVKIGQELLTLYKDAVKLLEGKQDNIPDLIDKAVEDDDPKLWNQIRKQIAEQSEASADIGKIEKQAEDLVKKYQSEKKSLMSKVKLQDSSVRLFNTTENELSELKNKFKALKALKLEQAKNYFNKIEEGRKHLLEELNILFPGIGVAERTPKLSESDIDLFLYYAVQKLTYYQKEIAKLESQSLDKLRKLVQSNPELQDAIDKEVSKARRQIKEDFDNKALNLKSTCEKKLHEQLKRQEQVHLDLLSDQLKLKEQEVERKLLQRVEEQVQEERNRLTQELAEMTAQMQALNDAISRRALQDMKAQASQTLWSATESLYNYLKRSSSAQSEVELKPKPLAGNVEDIRNAAAKGDDFVETILATIPKTARDRGVYPEDVLRDRFRKVESVAWKVAGVPEGGASLPMLFLLWIQSTLIIRSSEPIPPGELKNEPIDPVSLNNYDILQRARYWVERNDLEQALKYMNLLKGGARSVALDWMKDVTLLLEAQQATNLLLAHASATGMIYS